MIARFIEYREKLIENVFKYKDENFVKAPVAFSHIIQNIQGQMGLSSTSAVDITPFEYITMVTDTLQDIVQMFNPTEMFKVLYHFNLSPKDILVKKRFNKQAVELLLETIVLMYKKAIVHPGEMVGVIAGQSIGEPTTQLTLNSVTYETEIIVRGRNGLVKKVQIGDFTKEFIEKATKKEYYTETDTTYAELDEYYEVPSCNEDGACSWERIEAVTKHPVINKDGTNVMLRITTKENREVIATKAKSFLKLVDGKIIGVNGDTLRVGDYIPVSKKAIEYTESSHLDLKQILSPKNYLYGSEFEKAKSVMNEYHWWTNHSEKLFTLPYSRSDAFVDKINVDSKKKEDGSNTCIRSNCVYSKKTTQSKYMIPESIELNYNFGYLVGAYAAEGCMTKTQISISNNDSAYFAPILELCNAWNITTKVYRNENKNQANWTSQDLRIYNTLLCRILETLCGKLSHNKYVSPLIVFSNKECIRGFLDAYIGGDGTISKKSHTILMTSVSKQMLIDIQQMMNIVGVYAYISKPKKAATNNRGSQNIKQPYTLNVVNQQATVLAKMLNMKTATKQQTCVDYVVSYEHKYEYSKHATMVPNEIAGEIVLEDRNNRYEDVLFDRIISIEEVDNTTPYAYDLTVENTRNFNLYNGLCQRDTFHLAGVATKSNVTRGVPRIEEILRLTRNPDKPSATVYLKSGDQYDKDKAAKLCVMIEHTKLVDVVKSIEICFDPNDRATKIHKDVEVIDQFYQFEKLVAECNEGASTDVAHQSKWIVRMEIDPEVLLDKNITMDDINFAITNSHGSDVTCVFSDMNSSNLVFRIRLNSSVFNKGKKKGASESLDQSDEIHLLKTFQDNILNNIVLRGVSGIKNVNPRLIKDNVVKEDNKFVRKEMWVLDTVGTNIMDLFMLDFIDYTRTYSNDIREMHNILGIEAARQNILNEFVEVMEASDAYVNYHHLSILCDRMTVKADLVPMFRSGIISDDIGPISKGTYEMHTEMFLDASRHGEFDQMRGVSANVMCGQPGYYGTNAFGLLLDMKAIEETEDADVEIVNLRENIDASFAELLEKDDKCKMEKIAVDNNVSNLAAMECGNYDDDYSLF
jgi:intein/homing endonuclease